LVHVSGIPPLEAHMMQSRPEAYRAYCARVSAFFPALPKSWPKSGPQK
jgi:steroid 5-alpha reductase family enzyme